MAGDAVSRVEAAGALSVSVPAWPAGEPHEFRLAVKHPLLMIYSDAKRVQLP